MSESRSFNGKDFIEGDWDTSDITEESTYAYNRWHLDQRRQQIAAESKGQERLDAMTPEEIKAEWQQAMAQEEAGKRPEREYWAARQFMAERPDYVANPKNGQRIEEYIKAAKLDSTNPDHIHQAAKALESRGLLQTDPSKVEVKPRTRHSEEELYAMPWNELEKLARKSSL
jgi:hypothetical protein